MPFLTPPPRQSISLEAIQPVSAVNASSNNSSPRWLVYLPGTFPDQSIVTLLKSTRYLSTRGHLKDGHRCCQLHPALPCGAQLRMIEVNTAVDSVSVNPIPAVSSAWPHASPGSGSIAAYWGSTCAPLSPLGPSGKESLSSLGPIETIV